MTMSWPTRISGFISWYLQLVLSNLEYGIRCMDTLTFQSIKRLEWLFKQLLVLNIYSCFELWVLPVNTTFVVKKDKSTESCLWETRELSTGEKQALLSRDKLKHLGGKKKETTDLLTTRHKSQKQQWVILTKTSKGQGWRHHNQRLWWEAELRDASIISII